MSRPASVIKAEKKYRERNRQKVRDMARARYALDPERHRNYVKLWRARHPEKAKALYKRWVKVNRKRRDKINAAYRLRFPERVIERQRKYYRNNRLKIRKYFKAYLPEYRARQRIQNPNFLLVDRMRSRIKACLAKVPVKKSATTFELIGCTPAELKAHIENQFLSGMSWDNRERWHVDHRKPLASFDLTQPEQQREAFHYSNLQPLWATDNHRKGKKTAPLGSSTSVQERPLLQSKPT